MSKTIRSLCLAVALLAAPLSAFAGIFVSINIAPPVLPVYEQPLCPGDGYIWTPGYWAYGDEGYFWVPGTWVLAPQPGFLWTPGYWGWGGGVYLWHGGYWGSHVGFYGGVNYGFGYGGSGYQGGYWNNGRFNYNRTVNNVNVTNIHNTYNTTVINNTTVNRVSYNGGVAGTSAQPTAQERSFGNERHIQPTATQVQHQQAARADRSQLASVNGGRPAVFATPRPGAFHAQGVVSRGTAAPFSGGQNRAEQNRPASQPQRQAAPAYVQHQQAPQGQHTMIAPQARQNTAPQYRSAQPGGAGQQQRAPQSYQQPRPQQSQPRPQQSYQQPRPQVQQQPRPQMQQPRPQAQQPHPQQQEHRGPR